MAMPPAKKPDPYEGVSDEDLARKMREASKELNQMLEEAGKRGIQVSYTRHRDRQVIERIWLERTL